MLSALDAGIAGLRAAETRASVRAQNIVNWLSADYRPLVPQQTTGASGEPIVKVTRVQVAGSFPAVDLAGELVDLRFAKHAYQASAAVIRAADEMSKTLLDTFA